MSSAAEDQDSILRYLATRFGYGNQRFCTIPTILKNTGIEASNQYVLALMDELEMSGLVMTRQAYRVSGGNVFQITGKGIDFVRNGKRTVANSASWTGRIDVSEAKKAMIKKHLREIRTEIDKSKMTNAKRCNILAIVGAIETLIEAPDPPWAEILRLVRNPTLQGVLALAGILVSIVGLILPAARISK
ncbi:MAG: hypothetical protein AAGA34_08370 [Pseudomonadota bacterium]